MKNLLYSNSNELINGFEIKYSNEAGIDQGGLRREWFTLVSRELFSEKSGLFKISCVNEIHSINNQRNQTTSFN